MSDKQLVLETVSRLPDGITMEEISSRLEFMIAVRKGLDEIDRAEVVPHEEVKKQLATWLSS